MHAEIINGRPVEATPHPGGTACDYETSCLVRVGVEALKMSDVRYRML